MSRAGGHERACRVCGCTNFTPCTEPDGFPCCWVEKDLCSACAYHPENGVVEMPEEYRSFSVKEG